MESSFSVGVPGRLTGEHDLKVGGVESLKIKKDFSLFGLTRL